MSLRTCLCLPSVHCPSAASNYALLALNVTEPSEEAEEM
jgi:hypothetical protein